MSRDTTNFLIALACVTTAVTCWSGNWVIGRAIRADVPPVGLAFWRWVLASALLAPFVLREAISAWPVIRRNWKPLIGLATTGAVMFQAFTYIGLRSTEALNAVLLSASGPVFVVVMAGIIMGERLNGRQWMGLGISAIGAVYLVTRGDPFALANLKLNPGDLWILAALVAWGVYSALLKFRPAGISPTLLVFTTSVAGAVMLIPFYVGETVLLDRPVPLSMPTYLSVGYTAVFASIVAFLCYNTSIRRIGPGVTGAFLNLMPVIGSLMAMVFLGERLQAYHLVGFVVILAGVALATVVLRRKAGSSQR